MASVGGEVREGEPCHWAGGEAAVARVTPVMHHQPQSPQRLGNNT